MRLFFPALLLILCAGSAPKKAIAQTEPLKLYEVIPDASEKKTLRGIISKDLITKDTAFGWYADNSKYFRPDSGVVQAIRAKSGKIDLVIFCGTWCHDSQQLLPKYLLSLEAAGFPESKLTLIGVDRAKTTIAGLHNVFHIVSIPTIIVMQDGKEVGRVEEFGKTALVDKELGEIIKGL